MGCVSSKLFRKELHQEIIFNNGGQCVNHVVSLTSSTYGALKLDRNNQQQPPLQQEQKQEPIKEILEESKRWQRISPTKEDPEVVNTWELMGDLEEGVPVSNQTKRSTSSRVLLRGFADLDLTSPLKFLNQIGSPRKAKTYGGKENKVKRSTDFSPRPVLKANNSSGNSCKAVLRLSYPVKASPVGAKTENFKSESGYSPRRKSNFSPLFDPELVALYEKGLSEEEEEELKRIILPSSRTTKVMNLRDLESILRSFEQKRPPGGENKVVIYTTTLRGIRKTFEDCNTVRSIIESHHIHIVERDVSMDSGFKEELRELMGTNEVKVPLVFVKGRLIGGADQVVKLEEEGKLGILFDGIPKGLAGGCEGCAGVRFVMCVECNGSCKVLHEEQKKMVRCGLVNSCDYSSSGMNMYLLHDVSRLKKWSWFYRCFSFSNVAIVRITFVHKQLDVKSKCHQCKSLLLVIGATCGICVVGVVRVAEPAMPSITALTICARSPVSTYYGGTPVGIADGCISDLSCCSVATGGTSLVSLRLSSSSATPASLCRISSNIIGA
ncbi:hypothetical protein DKX38_024071 [Salix brachista]|uniref:Glutaredoxin domain-containing protein n=1 Tax=Salix brachista TaxID=2182728 RepID=A0A5N5JLD1_9ROSI|nr:hypothetical protein DKX38_024071 [Salix brachista]